MAVTFDVPRNPAITTWRTQETRSRRREAPNKKLMLPETQNRYMLP